jgi:hypothetical protein
MGVGVIETPPELPYDGKKGRFSRRGWWNFSEFTGNTGNEVPKPLYTLLPKSYS